MAAIILSTLLLNGEIPKITVGISSGLGSVNFPLKAEVNLAMAIFDQLHHPEAPEVWVFSEAGYALLVSEYGMDLTFEGA